MSKEEKEAAYLLKMSHDDYINAKIICFAKDKKLKEFFLAAIKNEIDRELKNIPKEVQEIFKNK